MKKSKWLLEKPKKSKKKQIASVIVNGNDRVNEIEIVSDNVKVNEPDGSSNAARYEPSPTVTVTTQQKKYYFTNFTNNKAKISQR